MAPKLKLGAKPGAKSGAKFGTKRGAKWCFGAKLDNAIMLHRPSVSLHRARRYRSQNTALAYGSTLSAYCCKGASIWHMLTCRRMFAVLTVFVHPLPATVLHNCSLCNVIVHCCRKYACAVWRHAGAMQQYTGPVQQKTWP